MQASKVKSQPVSQTTGHAHAYTDLLWLLPTLLSPAIYTVGVGNTYIMTLYEKVNFAPHKYVTSPLYVSVLLLDSGTRYET